MFCKKCGKKMVKESLKFSTYVGSYKYAYFCPYCIKKNKGGDVKCQVK